jgi:hypothetical protein
MFKKGDLINYFDNVNNVNFTGLILEKRKKVYSIQWFDLDLDCQFQTIEFIDLSSTLISNNNLTCESRYH